MMGAMTAGAGATGLRAWLAAHGFAWLTPQRMRVVTLVLLVGALLASSVLVTGSSTTTPASHAAQPAPRTGPD